MSKKYQKPLPQAPRRPMLDSRKRMLLIGLLLQNPNAFQALKDSLRPEHFKGIDDGYGVVWNLTLEFVEAHDTLPDKEQIAADLEDLYNADPNVITSTELANVGEMFDTVFDPATYPKGVESEHYTKWAIGVGRQFLEERMASKMRETIEAGTMLPIDLPGFFADFQREAEKAAALNTTGLNLAFVDGWDKQIKLDITSTGVTFVDHFLGGGDVPGEVYGILGPFGSCKTTMNYMLVVEAAKKYQELRASGGPHKLVFVCSYEARINEMRQRALGYAAEILRDRIETMTSLTDLTSSGEDGLDYDRLKPYERTRWHALVSKGEPCPGEQERAMKALVMLNDHVVFLDMTGHEHKGRGNGSFKEIARWMRHELNQRPGTIAGKTIVDYLGAMIKRYINFNNVDQSMLRHLITGSGLDAKSEIADVFNVPVYLFHQLSGDANKLNEASLADHTDSAESRSFAENLDFSMSIGKPNAEGIALFGCTKHRRQPNKSTSIIHVKGAYNAIADVSDKYTIGPNGKKLVAIADMARIKTDDEAKGGKKKNIVSADVTSDDDDESQFLAGAPEPE